MICWLQLPWRLLLNIKIHFIYSYRSHYWCFLVCWLQLPRRHFFNVKINFTHIIKIGRLGFSLSWLKGEVRENLELPNIDPNFNISFPTTACSLTFHKTNMLHNDLKRDAINEFGIKYWTSNPVSNSCILSRHLDL
jgi:hypothetical protein